MSARVSTALGLCIRELAHALVLVVSGAATVAMASVGAARFRSGRPRRDALDCGGRGAP